MCALLQRIADVQCLDTLDQTVNDPELDGSPSGLIGKLQTALQSFSAAPQDVTVTVDYASADGSASAGADYAAASGTLSFAPGETEQTIEVAVTGELDLVSASQLEETLKRELLADNDVLLDLSDMDFIDSTGLHAIVESVRTAKSVGRKLKLSAELPAHARRLMEIVGLLPFIPIAPE